MGRIVKVDVLSIFFGLGTWLCVNGLWVELPLLVQKLPEGWNLPSYLSVLIQMSNVGPLLYTFLNSFFPKHVTERRATYFVMGLGLVTTILLANFWKKTTFVSGEMHSTALLILVFFLATVDCSSRVLYLPFMSNFQEAYLISYFIGEGLSGFVPSIVALVQGVGGNPECRNATDPQTGDSFIEGFTKDPRFSVGVFFYFLFVFTFISLVAFYFLNKESVVQGALVPQVEKRSVRGRKININSSYSVNSLSSCSSTRENSLTYNAQDVSIFEEQTQPQTQSQIKGNNNDSTSITAHASSISKSSSTPSSNLSQNSFFYLLFLQIFICFLANGVFPSIQSYSCLPYGNNAYHLAVTLSNMANPAVCFLGFFISPPTTKSITSVAVMSLGVSGYVLYTALKSPSPPLVGGASGEVLLIMSWIILVALFTYVRVSIATILRKMGKAGLFWCGAVSQLGSALGALLAFFVVNYTKVFESYYPCT